MVYLFGGETGQLGGSFQHDHAGHYRAAGNVAWDPELVICDIFISHDRTGVFIKVDNRIQLAHFMSMWIYLLDRFDVDSPDVFTEERG